MLSPRRLQNTVISHKLVNRTNRAKYLLALRLFFKEVLVREEVNIFIVYIV